MPTAKTSAKLIHESLVSILTAGVASLKVDARDVKVISHFPDESISQRALPLVGIERPARTSLEPYGGDYERHVYAVPIVLVDNLRVGPDEKAVTEERLALLFDKMRHVLRAKRNLDLAYLHVYESMCSYDLGDAEEAANNLLVLPVTMTVPAIVQRGVVWST